MPDVALKSIRVNNFADFAKNLKDRKEGNINHDIEIELETDLFSSIKNSDLQDFPYEELFKSNKNPLKVLTENSKIKEVKDFYKRFINEIEPFTQDDPTQDNNLELGFKMINYLQKKKEEKLKSNFFNKKSRKIFDEDSTKIAAFDFLQGLVSVSYKLENEPEVGSSSFKEKEFKKSFHRLQRFAKNEKYSEKILNNEKGKQKIIDDILYISSFVKFTEKDNLKNDLTNSIQSIQSGTEIDKNAIRKLLANKNLIKIEDQAYLHHSRTKIRKYRKDFKTVASGIAWVLSLFGLASSVSNISSAGAGGGTVDPPTPEPTNPNIIDYTVHKPFPDITPNPTQEGLIVNPTSVKVNELSRFAPETGNINLTNLEGMNSVKGNSFSIFSIPGNSKNNRNTKDKDISSNLKKITGITQKGFIN